jgi:hypothetical protein
LSGLFAVRSRRRSRSSGRAGQPKSIASPSTPSKTLFAKIARRRLERGVFRSVVELRAAINRFIDEVTDDPRPFVLDRQSRQIMAAVKRGRRALRFDPLAHELKA